MDAVRIWILFVALAIILILVEHFHHSRELLLVALILVCGSAILKE